MPVRYLHHPRGSDDANGLGKTSRFLTDNLQSLCDTIQTREPTRPLIGPDLHDRVTVAVDELWR